MTDGAAAALVVSEAFLARTKLAPLGRFVSFAVKGVAPELMGIGPVEAIPAALARAGLRAEDVASSSSTRRSRPRRSRWSARSGSTRRA